MFYKPYIETPMKGIPMNTKKKLTKIKNQIKKHAPEIILSLTTIASTAYAISVKKALAEEAKRFPTTDSTYLLVTDEVLERMQNGEAPYWMVEGHKIGVKYQPDC
jgi:hypothetical protein